MFLLNSVVNRAPTAVWQNGGFRKNSMLVLCPKGLVINQMEFDFLAATSPSGDPLPASVTTVHTDSIYK